jgi:hypothetical protein
MTIALLAIALMAVRVMARLNQTTEELSGLTQAVRESAVEFDLVSHEARALLASLRDCVPPVLRVVGRLDAISQRAANLSSTLLEELEVPVFTAAAMARGVRSGANHFLKRLMQRFIHPQPAINGGPDHE